MPNPPRFERKPVRDGVPERQIDVQFLRMELDLARIAIDSAFECPLRFDYVAQCKAAAESALANVKRNLHRSAVKADERAEIEREVARLNRQLAGLH